ncbi:hypothetical protein C8A00DRAFT_16079 [Chaetomidium leptoderma]|uniref:C2H2 type master regulator of conidiophore development brlA n=1 Tax=Chaetomidium leptoderma TaxID=669021 RepID=A0AAN6VJC3_9PEZI|nr:hypothetical protein C8A00DRAFT_16079 [Chaetomidium leptoderma]
MALGSLPSTTEAWGRWPQPQHGGPDFNMMDAASMVPYDCRTPATAAPMPRPELAQHFLPGPFNPAPMPSPASPQYQAPISYGGYNLYSQPQMLDAPFRHNESIHERMDGMPFLKRSRSPSIKSEARSTTWDSPPPKADITNVRVPGPPFHQFNTAIDKLVRVIEAKLEILSPKEESVQPDEKMEEQDTQRGRGKGKRKRFCCDIPGCSKMFAQKNNLDTHRRSHTGESPYTCPHCFSGFTQSVNLKSHINRHTGARPYKCPECPKRFPQPSNVKAHMKTHVRRELRAHWVCRFANCQKAFTAKGNLKNHQNTYHVEAIEAFKAKLAATMDKGTLSEEEQEMARYIADVHNLANKGIKGRGKGRKVRRVTNPMNTTTVHANPYPMSLLQQGLPNLRAPPQQPTMQQHGLPMYGLSNPAAYSMSRPPNNMLFGGGLAINTRDTYGHGGYGMLDSDQLSDASSVHGSTPVMHMYEEEHARELAFGERLY